MDTLESLLVANILTNGRDKLECEMPNGRVLRRTAKIRTQKRIKEQQLKECVDEAPKPGESIHIVANGKYDFATWIPTLIGWMGTADALLCSTWTLSRPNALEIFAIHDTGQIAKGQLHFLTGLYFKRRETAVYSLLLQGIAERGGRYRAFENHCKVLLLSNKKRRMFLTVEGSANLNANPRFEQYVLTNDRELHDFHRGWMDDAFTSPGRQRKPRAERKGPTLGFHCRRAGLGVLAFHNDPQTRKRLIREKMSGRPAAEFLDQAANDVAAVARTYATIRPGQTLVTVPPQGASWPKPYLAAALGERVAALLDVPFDKIIARTDAKTAHHPHAALKQAPFELAGKRPKQRTIIVVDDLITSGTTMRLSIEALRRSGCETYGFAYNAS